MRVLVCGSRQWPRDDYEPIQLAMVVAGHEHEARDMVLIHGDAPGVDQLAAEFAKEIGWQVVSFPANWKTLGRSAGPVRNQRMLDIGKPDLVLAFPLLSSRGTYDMVRRAKRAGIPVEVHEK